MNIALAGNQNCGKTTLFNQLTGSNQHVGNFPGVTVDKKEGEVDVDPKKAGLIFLALWAATEALDASWRAPA